MTEITRVSAAEKALAGAATPAQTKVVEAMAAAAKAYHREQGDYEGVVDAARVYILARRKTTQLIAPHIRPGRPEKNGDNDVTFLEDYGFTRKQWQRRRQELEVDVSVLEEYFYDCIEKHTEPTSFGLVRYATGDWVHVAQNSGENEWYTPPVYIESARRVMGGIDLDPASSEVANRVVKATKFYTIDDDGLRHGWSGRVWMNPPYAAELIGQFCERLAASAEEETVTEAIALVNNATETHWFRRLVDVASAVVFTYGRVKFLDPQGNPGAPLQGQAVVYTGPKTQVFLEEFAKFGWGAQLWK